MITRSRLHLALLLSSFGVAAVASTACGGISDPTKGGGTEGRVATVSGALTGVTVPANARVALVYRKVTTDATGSHGTVEVGTDVAAVGGKFTMNLGVPADEYFSSTDGTSFGNVSSPPSTGVLPAPAPEGSAGGGSGGTSTSGSPGAFHAFGAAQLTPRDIVSGQITEPLSAAVAGFVVYADTNGNGKLDLEGEYASSPDQILGGNNELMLVYLKGGGSLDYEKMRDKSGILPTAGFDLAWTEGRWLPLTEVELKLTANAQLPSPVCQSSYGVDNVADGTEDVPPTDPTGTNGAGTSGGTPTSSVDAGAGPSSGSSSGGDPGSGYPSPSDPNLHCSPDGRSYTYSGGDSTCPPPPPVPTGLCAGDVSVDYPCAIAGGYGNALASDAPVPAGWPCPTDSSDGGTADGGSGDGGFAIDGGAADGGS